MSLAVAVVFAVAVALAVAVMFAVAVALALAVVAAAVAVVEDRCPPVQWLMRRPPCARCVLLAACGLVTLCMSTPIDPTVSVVVKEHDALSPSSHARLSGGSVEGACSLPLMNT